MIQKWGPLARSFHSHLPKIRHSSLAAHLHLPFSANVSPPVHLPTAPPIRPLPKQVLSRDHFDVQPSFQISKAQRRCFRCGVNGHFARSCEAPVRCFLCGDFGHNRFRCLKLRKFTSDHSSSKDYSGVENPLMTTSSWSESSERFDSMLLNPEVLGYLESVTQQGEDRSDGVGCPLLEVLREQVSKQGRLLLRTSFTGSILFKFGRRASLTSRYSLGLLHCSGLRKGMKSFAPPGWKLPANYPKLPVLPGKPCSDLVMPSGDCSSSNELPILEDSSLEPFPDLADIALGKSSAIDLSPFGAFSKTLSPRSRSRFHSEDEEEGSAKVNVVNGSARPARARARGLAVGYSNEVMGACEAE